MTDRTPRLSAAEWIKMHEADGTLQKPKRKNKFNAQSTLVDGLHFPSKLEAAVYCTLKMDKATYRNITRYPSVKLPGGVVWKIDLACESHFLADSWTPRYVEIKGIETADYKVKLKLYEEFGDRPLDIWKGTHKKPYLWKTIIPRGIK